MEWTSVFTKQSYETFDGSQRTCLLQLRCYI